MAAAAMNPLGSQSYQRVSFDTERAALWTFATGASGLGKQRSGVVHPPNLDT